MSTSPANPRTPRIPDFVLTSDELRAVTAFNLACAEQVIDLFEEVQPNDTRPKEALNAAAAFVGGGPRSMAQRVSALAAHRAAKEVDRHSSGRERLLVLLVSKIGEIRKISIELGGLGSDRRDHILVAGSASP